MADRGPVPVPLAFRADELFDLLLQQVPQHAEPDLDRQRDQPLLRYPNQLPQCLLHAPREPALPPRPLGARYVALHGGSSLDLARSPITLPPGADGPEGPPSPQTSTSPGTTSRPAYSIAAPASNRSGALAGPLLVVRSGSGLWFAGPWRTELVAGTRASSVACRSASPRRSDAATTRLSPGPDSRDASGPDGKLRLQVLISELEHRGYQSAARCLAEDLDALVVHLRYPLRHRERWRSTNLLERSLGEVRRRTKVMGRFPGETSCLSLVWAVLDLFFSHASNGATFTDVDRQHLYRIKYQQTDPDTLDEDVTAA